MKILIVAATWLEVKLLADEFEFINEKSHILRKYRFASNEIDILISGIGSAFTSFHLTQTLQNNSYNLVLNLGIAGSFIPDLKIGEVVNVISDEFADLGIENKNEFITLFEAGFMNKDEYPFSGGILKSTYNGFANLRNVRGLTTNKSHGKESAISEINDKFRGHIESMEGAAVFYVSSWIGIPCAQVRAISNFIEPRDPLRWNIPVALENLKNVVIQELSTF